MTLQVEEQSCRSRAEVWCRQGGAGGFSPLQVSSTHFLFFFPKVVIFGLIKSHLSLTQCAKLMGLGGNSDPPLGEWGRELSSSDHRLCTES